jgi:hypothetical protein
MGLQSFVLDGVVSGYWPDVTCEESVVVGWKRYAFAPDDDARFAIYVGRIVELTDAQGQKVVVPHVETSIPVDRLDAYPMGTRVRYRYVKSRALLGNDWGHQLLGVREVGGAGGASAAADAREAQADETEADDESE